MKYRKGYKYQLAEDELTLVKIRPDKTVRSDFIILSTEGILLIKKGYAWDGPSGPAIDTKTFMRGSLVHDALYQLIREGKLWPSCRALADAEMKKICKESGMCSARAWWTFHGVRWFASFAADPDNKRPIIEVE